VASQKLGLTISKRDKPAGTFENRRKKKDLDGQKGNAVLHNTGMGGKRFSPGGGMGEAGWLRRWIEKKLSQRNREGHNWGKK